MKSTFLVTEGYKHIDRKMKHQKYTKMGMKIMDNFV